MKFKTLICASASLMAIAAHAQSNYFEDSARVVRVTPQYEQINQPRQECRTEYETRERYRPQERHHSNNNERSNGGALLGGIAGGLLGSQVGGGNGKIAAAAAGALIGGLAGDRIDNNNAQPAQSYYDQPSYETRPVRQCRNVEQWETRANGYAVTYEYQGRSYTTIMPYDPGPRLRLNVALTPRM